MTDDKKPQFISLALLRADYIVLAVLAGAYLLLKFLFGPLWGEVVFVFILFFAVAYILCRLAAGLWSYLTSDKSKGPE